MKGANMGAKSSTRSICLATVSMSFSAKQYVIVIVNRGPSPFFLKTSSHLLK